jgi:hypothetical protein
MPDRRPRRSPARALHYVCTTTTLAPLCGTEGTRLRATTQPVLVTCRRCLALLGTAGPAEVDDAHP